MKYYRLLLVQLPRFKEKILWSIIILQIGLIFHFMFDTEVSVFRFINGLHTPWLDVIILPLTFCGDGVILAILIIAIGISKGWKELIKTTLIVISAGLIVQAIKYFYPTPRPAAILDNIHTIGPVFQNKSFPSGHTAGAFGLATYLGQKFHRLKLEAWIVAALVGLSRIYVGAHFFGDVIFGAGIGYMVTVVFLHKDYLWPKV